MDATRDYYHAYGEREWRRLESPEGAIEFAVNCAFIESHIAEKTRRVLDIGGGPGRYSLWLAEQGYRVTLADLSPRLLDIARARVANSPHSALVEEITEADARDLSRWPDASFDMALCMGPFYHLPRAQDRDQVARELRRVLRVGGVAVVAFMTRNTFLRRTIAVGEERRRLLQPSFMRALLNDGAFINDNPGRFTNGYGALPQEIGPFFDAHGFQALRLLSSESIALGLEETVAAVKQENPALYDMILRQIIRAADDPSVLGMADHLLYIGVKR